MHSLETILGELKPHIVILAETQLMGRCKTSIQDYQINGEANRNNRSGGILIATRNNTNIETTIMKTDTKNQQMWAMLKIKNYKLRICLCYGYANESAVTEEDLEEWYIKLEEEYLNHMEYETLLIGDFNAHTGSDGLPLNRNGKMLNSLIERRELINLNEESICQGKFTREDPKGTRTVIDYAIVDNSLISKIKSLYIDDQHKYKICRYKKANNVSKEITTDHNSMIIKMEIPIEKNTLKRHTIWNLSNKECQQLFKTNSENIKMKENWELGGDINKKYQNWEKQIKSLMYKSFQRITIKQRINNSTIKDLITEKRKINQKISEIQKLNLDSNVVLTTLKEIKGQVIEKIIDEINKEQARRNKIKIDQMSKNEISNQIWQIRKRSLNKSDIKHVVKDSKGKLLTNKDEILNRYQEYYKQLLENRKIPTEYQEHTELTHENFTHRMQTKIYDNLQINQPFTMKEIDQVIKTMKPGKAPGPDGITYEIVQNAGTNLKSNIQNMINYFWNKEEIPTTLQCLYIKSMYKGKGGIDELENQRGLFLSSIIIKLYEKLIMNRAYPVIEKHGFSKYQLGARKQKSPTDQVFIIRSIIEHMNYMGRTFYIEFCDLKKAYDKMILKNVMNDLWNSTIKGKIWRNIYKINENTDIIVKTPYGNTQKTKVEQILKQGSVLASIMAALHTDTSTKYDQHELGIWYGQQHLNSLLFQDDIARIETSPTNLNIANKYYEVFQDMNGMLFHERKTVYITNSKEQGIIKINNGSLDRKTSTRYLGDIITNDGKYQENIEDRKLSINGMIAEIKSIMQETKEDIEISAAKQYHLGIIVPKLIYNAESWINLTQMNIQELEKIQSNSLKLLLRIPYSTPTMGLLLELKIPSIKATIDKKKLLYLHKLLLQTDTLAHQILKQQETLHSNHFLNEVHQLMNHYNIQKTIDQVSELSKYCWKNIVNKAIEEKDKKEMQEWCSNSKKCQNLKANNDPNDYINTLESQHAKILLLEKINMTKVKINYKRNYENLLCALCKTEEETTEHLLNCQALDVTSPEILQNYSMFKINQRVQPPELRQIAQTLDAKLQLRDKLQSNEASITSIDADN